MPFRQVVTKALGNLLGVLSHPQRLQIVEALRHGEMDVNSLQAVLASTHARVSQHLSLMRAHRLVVERRAGRRVLYRLHHPDLAVWLVRGLDFVDGQYDESAEVHSAVETARICWLDREPGR